MALELTPHTDRYRAGGAFAAIAQRLGRTEGACRDRYNRLMKAAGHDGGQWTEEGLWTPEEDAVIRSYMYGDESGRVPMGTWPAIAEELDRTPGGGPDARL